MTTTNPQSRRTLYLLAALFLLPIAGSFALYYGAGWRPSGQTNHGELLEPARPLPQVAGVSEPLHGKWSLVYVGDGACDADCRQGLVLMRQTRLALNAEMDRVTRVWLATNACCDKALVDGEHRGLVAVDASGAAAQPLLAVFPREARAQSLFVVDPLGNVVMRYDARAQPKGLLTDIKKLLKLSHIG